MIGAVTTRSWRDGVLLDDALSHAELATAAHDPACLVWVDLVAPDADALGTFAADLGLPATAVEDALAPHERPKLVRHEGYLFFTVYAVAGGDAPPDEVPVTRVSGWVLPTALVTIRLDDRFDMAPVVRAWEDDPALLDAGGAGALVHGLLDAVVDGQFAAIQSFDDRLEAVESLLFGDRPTGARVARTVFDLRKALVSLRRVVLPMREVVNGLMRHSITDPPALRPWFDDLYDHVLRASEWTESLRDLVTSAFETNLALTDARLNSIMKKLAGWAAVIAVPTAITGWFGQNVPFPGFQTELGLWLSAAIIAVASVTLFFVFRSRDWL